MVSKGEGTKINRGRGGAGVGGTNTGVISSKQAKALRYVSKRFGRALTRLSER